MNKYINLRRSYLVTLRDQNILDWSYTVHYQRCCYRSVVALITMILWRTKVGMGVERLPTGWGKHATLVHAGNYSNSSASMPLLRSKVKGYRATHPSYSIRCFGWNVTTGYILEPNGALTRSRVSVPSDYSWKSNFHQILSVKNRESRLWRLPEGQRARTY